MQNHRLISLSCILLLMPTLALAQAVVRVPSDVPTLGQAIDRVNDGGSIILAQGTYTAPPAGFRVQNPRRSFTIRAANNAQVILQGGGGPVFRVEATGQDEIRFENLTFQGGVSVDEARGGGVTVTGSRAVFRGCTFLDNRAEPLTTGGGGARVADGSRAVFAGCTFEGNTSPNRGGGLAVVAADAFVVDSVFTGNSTRVVGHRNNAAGGGIYVLDGRLRLWNSELRNNSAGWVGGGVYVFGTFPDGTDTAEEPAAEVVVLDTIFEGNFVGPDPCCTVLGTTVGGGLHAEDQATVRIYTSTFLENEAERGGGVNLYRAHVDVDSSIFRGNRAEAPISTVSAGSAIAVSSADFNDGSTEFGARDRRVGRLRLTESFLQGRFQGNDNPAHVGGCIHAAGDTTRLIGAGVPQTGSAADHRALVEIDRSFLTECTAERPEGAPGGFGVGGALQADLARIILRDSLVLNSKVVGAVASGGGVSLFNESRGTFRRSTFAGNSAESAGGALFANGSTLEVDECNFFGNEVSPGLSEAINQSLGAAIFTSPRINAGQPALERDAVGFVEDSLFSANVGLPIRELDRNEGPRNEMTYDGNRFFSTSFGDKVFVNNLRGLSGDSAAVLNSLVISRTGTSNTDKSDGGNLRLTARPVDGDALAAPRRLIRGTSSGNPLAFIGYACGTNATIGGAAATDPAGIVPLTQTATQALRVSNTQVDTATVGARQCTAGPTMCLTQERFRVMVDWRTNQGDFGLGEAEQLTGDTGYFWFFNPANVEVVLKVLDASSFSNFLWLFYGALSNVQYEITAVDSETGRIQSYFNPQGNFASVGDTTAFPDVALAPELEPAAPPQTALLLPWEAAIAPVTPAMATCTPTATSLCLGGRFTVEVSFVANGEAGIGQAEMLTEDTGFFWFFSPTNVEVVLKVLDATSFSGFFWVFYGALSNVEYEITVTDTMTGNTRTYSNPQGNFASVGDTQALPGDN
jgi:hypothetical protein